MAIYSTHPSRGKVQILSTYCIGQDWKSVTVTSVNEDIADQLCAALNAVVQHMWAPDLEFSIREPFQRDHLAAVTDPAERPGLLVGEHDLWYDTVRASLFHKLNTLDKLVAPMPEIVRAAVHRELQDEIDAIEEKNEREWGDSLPKGKLVPWDYELLTWLRPRAGSLREAVVDMRLILDVATETNALEMDLTLEVDGDGLRCAQVEPPLHTTSSAWEFRICEWDRGPDDPGPQDLKTIAVCRFTERPDAADLISFLTLSAKPGQLTEWGDTPVGEDLRGTPFVVTERPQRGSEVPDFAALFPVEECGCNDEECERCSWTLTPRTAMVLWSTCRLLADQSYDDINEFGNCPVDPKTAFVLCDLPPIAQHTDAAWRYQFAPAFSDLATDLEGGRWPLPRCIAEEVALHLVLERADGMASESTVETRVLGLPEHEDDFDWDMCSEVFFQDHDFKLLYDASFDGIEAPGSQPPHLGMGDMRVAAWFNPFDNVEPRDPARGFRR